MLKVKKVEEIDKLREAYRQITAKRTKEVSFKIPKLLYSAMHEAMLAEGWSVLSGYYIHLVGFRFYCRYQRYFELVLSGQQAMKNSMRLDDLPSSTLSQHTLEEVMSYGNHKSPIRSRSCPAILLDVCNYLQLSLNSKESRHLFFRRLTLPLAIEALENRINQQLKAMDENKPITPNPKRTIAQQLSLNKWWKK